jgi:hypothetical protein
MWIVAGIESVEPGNVSEKPMKCFLAEEGYPAGDNDPSANERTAEDVVHLSKR